jgi:hypothetical protein
LKTGRLEQSGSERKIQFEQAGAEGGGGSELSRTVDGDIGGGEPVFYSQEFGPSTPYKGREKLRYRQTYTSIVILRNQSLQANKMNETYINGPYITFAFSY